MSFLDNLENNLKALENREEKDPEKVAREQAARQAERAAALQAAPHAEALRTSAFTSELLRQCRTIGHGLRVLVRFTWMPNGALRLDAPGKGNDANNAKRLELQPTPQGIVAVRSLAGVEQTREALNLQTDDAQALAASWLNGN